MSTCDWLDLETRRSRPISEDTGASSSGTENIIQGPFPMKFVPLPLNHYAEGTILNIVFNSVGLYLMLLSPYPAQH